MQSSLLGTVHNLRQSLYLFINNTFSNREKNPWRQSDLSERSVQQPVSSNGTHMGGDDGDDDDKYIVEIKFFFLY